MFARALLLQQDLPTRPAIYVSEARKGKVHEKLKKKLTHLYTASRLSRKGGERERERERERD